MKNTLKSSLAATIAAVAVLASALSYGQATITTTTTTADGTISEYSPQSLIISSAGAPPIRYSYNETTTYVDELGNPVSASVVRSGLPVTVHYSQVGDALLASRVVVRRGGQAITTTTPVRTVVPAPAPAATVTTTETTATGYINEFGPQAIVVRSEGATPLRYRASADTVYVDEFGSPVSVETVRSGAPVTVHYSRIGDELTASRVIVRKAAVAPAPVVPVAPVERTTTTTTTIRSSDDDDDEE